ncbi:MAG: S8 family serine peptidase [Trueperaceae bacterium]|nr:S8 family serine peptidase [Trueperaceae bacterium]
MKRALKLLPLLAVGVLLAACGNLAAVQPTAPSPEIAFPSGDVVATYDPFTAATGSTPLASVPRVWFVEVDAPALVDGGSIATQGAALAGVQAAASDAGLELTPRYTFSTFVSGFSAELEPAELLVVSNLPGVRSVSPVGLVGAPQVVRHEPGTFEPAMYSALAMTGADFAQDTLGATGAGVNVGIIDTGITLDHPEFAGRIGFGFDFVGDLYDAGNPLFDDPQPEGTVGAITRPGGGDCNGHGTHVAGIVGAGGVELSGVAPEVTLGAYRVFGCEGSSHSDVILAAIELAFADGMDVVNLSLGSNNGFADDFLSVALARMLEFGMIAVTSAGNNGASGVYTIGAPGAGDAVITVASVDNTTLRYPAMEVGGELLDYDVLDGAPTPPSAGTTPAIVYVGQGCAADAYLADPAGLVVLVTRGACAFSEKYERAVAAGAVGVIIENNADANFSGTLGGTYGPEFGVSVSGVDGAFIKTLVGGDPAPFVTWTDLEVVNANPTSFLASAFSSYGLAPDLGLKPDVAAPGGFITSTYIDGALPDGASGTPSYAVLSGTSMASPQVAGAVALLLQTRPDLEPERIRDALQNSADPFLPWSLNPGLGFALESVHRQGAGLIQVDSAILSANYAVPAKLSLGESADGTYVDVITLHNDTASEVTYLLTQIEAFNFAPIATVGNTDLPDFDLSIPTVAYYELRDSGFFDPIEQVTVPAGSMRSFQVRVTADPTSIDTTVFGTYLVFLPTAAVPGATPITVPAAGFVGDYQALPTFSECGISLEPFLAFVDGEDVYFLPEGSVFTMRDGDVPTFGFGLAHPADRVVAQFVPQGERSWMGPQPGFEIDLVRRNNPCTVSTFGLGDLDASALPNGAYTIRLSVLKAEGDPTNAAHTEVVETPTFVIDRFAVF